MFNCMISAMALSSAFLGGCIAPDDPGRVKVELLTPQARASHVLVVINSASSASQEIGAYYRFKREIPKENVVFISVSQTENVDQSEFENGILTPIRTAIKKSKNRIDYIVTTSGVPLRIGDNNGYSVDAFLASMNLPIKPIKELTNDEIRQSVNPYYQAKEPFQSDKYNMYLVTRLTGYSTEDAKKLVDTSLAAKKSNGPFFFDMATNRTTGGYLTMNNLLKSANEKLKAKGLDSQLDETVEFILPPRPLMGYCSWGSNDGAFNLDTYKNIKFQPGSICETYVSTSGRTFNPTTGGQSLIADLIKNGVTGIKGYVSEPYTFALAEPDILFERYVSGFNLAESFYMASKVTKWKDIVVGDPLCSPYSGN